MNSYYLNLQKGSGIGSMIMLIIGSLYILETKNIHCKLYVNIHSISKITNYFINNVLDKNKIKDIIFINKPYNELENLENYIELVNLKEEKINEKQISIYWLYRYYFIIDDSYSRYLYFFEKLWIIKKEYKFTEMLKKYDICVNLRRGCKSTLEPYLVVHTVPQYIDIINQLNLENPQIIHTCCSYETFLEFKELEPNLNIENSVDNISCRGYWISDFEIQSDEEIKSHIKDFMKQLEFMEKTPYLIGSSSTNVAFIISFLRKKKMNNDIYNYYFHHMDNLKIIDGKVVKIKKNKQ